MSMGNGLFKDLVVGAVAGYVGTKVMDNASTLIYERQSESTRQREEQLRTEMPTTVLVRKATSYFGKDLDDTKAGTLGMAVHLATGTTGVSPGWCWHGEGCRPWWRGWPPGWACSPWWTRGSTMSSA